MLLRVADVIGIYVLHEDPFPQAPRLLHFAYLAEEMIQVIVHRSVILEDDFERVLKLPILLLLPAFYPDPAVAA